MDFARGFLEEFAHGSLAFSELMQVWREENQWSYRNLKALSAHLTGGENWINSTQLAAFSKGEAIYNGPSPRFFKVISRINVLAAAVGSATTIPEAEGLSDALVAILKDPVCMVCPETGLLPSPGMLLDASLGECLIPELAREIPASVIFQSLKTH